MNLGLANAFSLLALAVVPAAATELPAPDELLAAAIARHDPQGDKHLGTDTLMSIEAVR